jgi:hypothetical protein
VQEAKGIARGLGRDAASAFGGDEPLDVAGFDHRERELAKRRREARAQGGTVGAQRGRPAPERLSVGDQARAGLGYGDAFGEHADQVGGGYSATHLALGLGAGEALAGPGRAHRSELALDALAVVVPAPVPIAGALIERSAAISSARFRPTRRVDDLAVVWRPRSSRLLRARPCREAWQGVGS